MLSTILIFIDIQVIAQPAFRNVADSCGIHHTYSNDSGGGVSFYDFNQDGMDDLTFATGIDEPIHFYENQGGTFSRITIPSISNTHDSKHIIWVDFDNDGDADLFVSSFNQNHLYRNTGQFEFEEITGQANLPLTIEPTYGVTWGDYDRDGWLDLYVTDKKNGSEFKKVSNHLYRNIQGGHFEEVTLSAQAADSAKAPFCAAFLDINNNGWQDIYIAQDRIQGNSMLKNLGNGTFRDYGEKSGTNLRMNAMCVAVADYNNDEMLDIYVSNTPEGNALFRNDGNELFSEIAGESGVGFYEMGWGSSFLDYDNDGFEDLYVCNMFGKNKFYLNQEGSYFIENTDLGFNHIALSYSCATGDFNQDGFPDLVVNNADNYPSTLWQNPGYNENNWMKIKLTGTYSNREGTGSRIVVYVQGETHTRYCHSGIGFLAQDSQYKYVGVGQNTKIDSLKIYWLSGIVDRYYDLEANRILVATEGETDNIEPKLNISGVQSLCDSEISALNTGYFSDRFKYRWSNGESGIQIFPEESGEYFAEIEDLQGNKYTTDTVYLTLREGPAIAQAVVTNISCNGANDGGIALTIEGGTSPYQINWQHGEEGMMIEDLEAGDYEVVITDNKGCSLDKVFRIFEPKTLNITANRGHDIDSTSVGFIEVYAIGGTPPYTFHWLHDLQEDSPAVYGLGPGTYQITVIDSRNCTVKQEFEVYSFMTTGFAEDQSGLKIYPNPASTTLFIDSPRSQKVRLYDMNGRLMISSTKEILDIHHLPDGIYLLRVGEHSVMKIIINKQP